MRYEYLTHTADAKFKAYGRNDSEKFENCAYAMFGIIVNPKEVKPVKEISIEVEAKNLRGLLYDFLDELLYYHDVEDFVLNKVLSIEVKDNNVKATVVGDSYKNYETHGHIKAITYNDFEYADDHVIMVMDL
ncbi:archease [Candidatus Woesearchaeota archaeon]|nr:MAG: archease [Candidatus Woesearchaeota archaeon]